jgi:hypothetical protein
MLPIAAFLLSKRGRPVLEASMTVQMVALFGVQEAEMSPEDAEKVAPPAQWRRAMKAAANSIEKERPEVAVKAVEKALLLFTPLDLAMAFFQHFAPAVILFHPRILWRALHSTWSSFDEIPYENFELAFKLATRKTWRKIYFGDADLAFRSFLPDQVEIYRGLDAGDDKLASRSRFWRRNRDVAKSVACGPLGAPNANPLVLTQAARQLLATRSVLSQIFFMNEKGLGR